ncbi:hypothetical protein CFOL_v3_21718 [Cephalotus follicularis]|uniref:Uncharacterized protein n=1 Tax=Cephalotus follicularis TaxID=3775 RepID=A0A1Q3CDE7_CEPFO|nr:hypothetical protein CFOL_v3_21718 [Cephalotus follicularis]
MSNTNNSTPTRPLSGYNNHNPYHPINMRAQQQQQQHPILYPLSSSGRGFMPLSKTTTPTTTTTSTINNHTPSGYPPRPAFSSHRPPIGSPPPPPPPHLDSVNNLTIRAHQDLHHPHLRPSAPGPIKGIPLLMQQPQVAPSPSSAADSNGFKILRDKGRDDNLFIVRDRKVRISDGVSLYSLCRSWLRNGFPEESQPLYGDGVKSLPRPSPIPVADMELPKKNECEDPEEEDEKSIHLLSAEDLLKGHIKRAKRVRARLREERLKRIARYKSRLALLLPPLAEQFRNDTATGN